VSSSTPAAATGHNSAPDPRTNTSYAKGGRVPKRGAIHSHAVIRASAGVRATIAYIKVGRHVRIAEVDLGRFVAAGGVDALVVGADLGCWWWR
jgi:hypothetical protein